MLWKAAPGQFDTQTQIMRLQKAVEKIFPIRFKLTAIVIQVALRPGSFAPQTHNREP